MTPRWKIRREDGPWGVPVWQIYDGDFPRQYFYVWENALTWVELYEAA